MKKSEFRRQERQTETLLSLGFNLQESATLRRISLTLHRWAEHECNGTIERDENRDNRPFWSNPNTGRHFVAPVADRERGAMKRLDAIFTARNVRAGLARDSRRRVFCSLCRVYGITPTTPAVFYHIQGDPRGVALYILPDGQVPGDPDVDYSRGIAVY